MKTNCEMPLFPKQKKIVNLTVNGTHKKSASWIMTHERNVPGKEDPIRIVKNGDKVMENKPVPVRELIALTEALKCIKGDNLVVYIKMHKGHVFNALTKGFIFKWHANAYRNSKGHKTRYADYWQDFIHEWITLQERGTRFFVDSVKTAKTHSAQNDVENKETAA